MWNSKEKLKVFSKFEAVPRGTCKLKQSGKLLAVTLNDKRDVCMVTTEHKRQMINSGKVNYFTKEPIMKPDCVVDYNKNMHLVDKADMQISSVECVRKTAKWHKKLFFHVLDIVMLNVYNMFRVN